MSCKLAPSEEKTFRKLNLVRIEIILRMTYLKISKANKLQQNSKTKIKNEKSCWEASNEKCQKKEYS